MSGDAVNSDEKVFGEKLSGVNYIDRIGVYGIVIDNEGKIATIKTPTGYFLPGGGIEIGETHKECIEREFIEETGFEVLIEKYIGMASLYHISKTNQYLHGIGYFYTVNLKSMTNKKTEEDHELIWIEQGKCVRSLFLEHQAWAVSEALKGKV
jgi:8-oxo-dGTP diphosphatase